LLMLYSDVRPHQPYIMREISDTDDSFRCNIFWFILRFLYQSYPRSKPPSFLETLRMTGSRHILKATTSGIKVVPSGLWPETVHLYRNEVPPRSALRMVTPTRYTNRPIKFRNFFAGEGTGYRSYVTVPILLHATLQILIRISCRVRNLKAISVPLEVMKAIPTTLQVVNWVLF
jgi:hypothetical protein